MRAEVASEVALLYKPLVTHVTRVLPEACVDVHVSAERAGLVEGLPTHIALERLLPRVYPLVGLNTVLLAELSPTDLTLEQAVFTTHSLVFVEFFPMTSHFVQSKLLFRAEQQMTNAALK